MRNDIYFRVHYPYGIVLDVENGTFALFNRYYEKLKKNRDEDIYYMLKPKEVKSNPYNL